MSTVFKLKRSSVKGKAPTTSNIALGEIAINTNDGRLFFKTTDSASSSAIVTLREISGGTGITETAGEISITNSGVVAATYGSSTEIPVLSINAQGQVDSATTVSVAGVSGLAYDSDTNLLTLSTADGGSYSVKINMDTFGDSDTTDDLTEGSTNLYYTDARVQTKLGNVTGHIIPATDSAYDLGSPTKKFRDLYLNGQSIYLGNLVLSEHSDQLNVHNGSGTQKKFDLAANTTSDIAEGTNQYFTTARARNVLSVQGGALSYDSASGVITYSEVAYGGFDSDFAQKTTSDLTEGSNLYYTDARARGSISVNDVGGDGSLGYNSGTGVLTYTGPSASETRAHFSGGTGVTITNGSVAIGQSVGTTDDVTFGKVTQDSAVANSIQLNRQQGRPNNVAGTLFFDSDHQKALSVNMSTRENSNPDVTLNIGQEIFVYVHNLTGAAINNGDAVYISGTAHGKHPRVSLARADMSSTGNPTGLATMDIPNGGHGWVTRYGIVRDLNTSGISAGSTLYLSPDSAGKWTDQAVTVDTGYPFHIGRVLTSDATNGTILVDGFSEHFEYLRIEDRLKVSGRLEADSASLLNVQFDTTRFDSHQPYSEGLLYYDAKHKTLNYNDDITGMNHEIGVQEHQRVFNNTGALIRKGSALYFSGNYTSGIIDVPTVGLADATDVNAYNAQGIAAQDIANNSYGHCLIAGQLTEVNTAHLSDGTNFFVSVTTPGSHQNESPTYPNFPMCLGWVVKTGDSDNGILLVNQQNHSVRSFRVQTSAHIGTDLQVDGNLTILGSTTTVGTSNVTQGAPFYRLNEGDAIGEAGTAFTGTGLDDAFFAGHFTGTTPQTYYVKIDGVGTGAGGVDTFAVALGTDSAFASPILTKQNITGSPQLIHSADNISVEFGATTGHDSGDRWSGTASPVNVDTGFFTNRNTGTSGVGYTHMGIFFDVTDEKWKLVDEYDSTPVGAINTGDASFSLATLVASSFEGNVTGALTGNADTATALATGRNFSLTGDITANAVSFDGTGAVTLTTAYNPGSIVNADINASANIADTKLATISTAGKVQNSATTATNANTGSTIVARDASGDFNAGTVTLDELFVGNLHVDSADITTIARAGISGSGSLSYNSSTGDMSFTERTASEILTEIKTVDGAASGLDADLLDGQQGSHYRINVYNSSGTLLN